MWNFHRTPWPERWGAEIERTIQRTIHFSLATHRPSLLRDRLFRDESMQRLNNFEFYRRILGRCAWAYERGSIDKCSSKRIKIEWYKKSVDGKKAFQNAFSEMNFTWKYTAVSDSTTDPSYICSCLRSSKQQSDITSSNANLNCTLLNKRFKNDFVAKHFSFPRFFFFFWWWIGLIASLNII